MAGVGQSGWTKHPELRERKPRVSNKWISSDAKETKVRDGGESKQGEFSDPG